MNKKAFTLVEMLGAIIILGLLAVIIVPKVTDIINTSKYNADLNSAKAYIASAEQYYADESLKGSYDEVNVNIFDKISVKGTKATTGIIYVGETGNVNMGIVINNRCYIKKALDDANTITVSTNLSDCSTVNAETPQSCFTTKETNNGVIITDYTCGDTFEGLDSNGNAIYDNDGKYTNIEIPSTINGKAVLGINIYAFGADNSSSNKGRQIGIKSVVTPSCLSSIDASSFLNNELTSATINGTSLGISNDAFANNNLTSLTINNGVLGIYFEAFKNNKLTSVTLPSSVTFLGDAVFNNNAFTGSDAFIYAIHSSSSNTGQVDNTTLVSYAGKERNNVVIPSTVVTIDNNAFNGLGISNITIPDSVVTIGSTAFANNNLSSVVLGNGVVTINYGAFMNNKLTTATVSASVNSISSYVFYKSSTSNPNLSIIHNKSSLANNSTVWNSAIAGYSSGDISSVTVTSP